MIDSFNNLLKFKLHYFFSPNQIADLPHQSSLSCIKLGLSCFCLACNGIELNYGDREDIYIYKFMPPSACVASTWQSHKAPSPTVEAFRLMISHPCVSKYLFL